jgi:hypothetical protein
MDSDSASRRAFVRLLPGLLLALAPSRVRTSSHQHCPSGGREPRQGGHPEPRKGIDASRVLKREDLASFPEAIPVFDGVRAMPQIADGIRCACGCSEIPGYYSLLSCFEGDGMATACRICQGQARLAHRLFKEGRSLEEIRSAIDAEFG